MAALLRIVATIAAMVLLWEAAARFFNSPLLMPSPALVGASALELIENGELFDHLSASLSRLAVGLLVGVPAGAIVGCAMGRFALIDSLFNPFVRMFNAVPAIALVPFSLLWLGVTEVSRYSLMFYTIFLTVLLSARSGVAGVPRIRMRAAASLGVTGASALFRVVIPSSIPSILAGVRTSLGLGVMVIVAAEMLGAERGLGYLIMQARSHFNIGQMLVGIIGLGILSLVLDRLFQVAIEAFLPRWSAKRRVR